MYGHILGTCAAVALTVYLAQPRQARWFHRSFRNGRSMHRAFIAIGSAVCVAQAILVLFHQHQIVEGILHTCVCGCLGYLVFLIAHQKIRSIQVVHPMRVLAIGAHPDDLEIACGGTISKLSDAGHIVHAIVMCNGKVGGNAEVRPGEARNGATFMGISQLDVYDFTDTELSKHELEIMQTIERKIDSFQPNVILTHSRNDQHQDHLAVHFATLRAARRNPSVLCYESPSTTRDFNPSFFVDLTDYVNVKLHAVAQHKDQLSKPYMGPEQIKGIAAFRGAQAKMKFAEGFEVVRLVDSSLAGM